MKTYPSQTIILKQGTEPNQVYIIRSGRVKAVKRVKWDKEEYVEIDELGDGELFGDFALLNEQELDCSYITAIPSEIIQISAFNLRKIVPQDTLEVYRKSLKKYPEEDELE